MGLDRMGGGGWIDGSKGKGDAGYGCEAAWSGLLDAVC